MLQPVDEISLKSISERIRSLVANCRDIEISVSIGGAMSSIGDDLSLLLQHADQALYNAKEAGRNCYRYKV